MTYRWKRIPEKWLPIDLEYYGNMHSQGAQIKIHHSKSTSRYFAQFPGNGYWYERVKIMDTNLAANDKGQNAVSAYFDK